MSKIYTDGSCLKNPGPGGWAFALIENNEIWYVSGGEKSTTNNRMEIKAVIEALKFSQNTNYIIYTDSQLVLNCAQKIWKRKSNIDLWNEYDAISIGKNLQWEWVRAHNGDKYNEIVDKMARKEATLIL